MAADLRVLGYPGTESVTLIQAIPEADGGHFDADREGRPEPVNSHKLEKGIDSVGTNQQRHYQFTWQLLDKTPNKAINKGARVS